MPGNCNYLIISYARISEYSTSDVDIIPLMKVRDALGKGLPLIIRSEDLSTGRYVLSDCTVDATDYYSEKTGRTYEVHLTFGESDLNSENNIDRGVLKIIWDKIIWGTLTKKDDLFDVVERAPDRVYWYDEGVDEPCAPSFTFVEHWDNRSGYFYRINEKGQSIKTREIFHKEEHAKLLRLYPEDVIKAVTRYVRKIVESRTEFSVGTLFPQPWNDEMIPLHDVLATSMSHDEAYEKAAYTLSGIVQTIILESPTEWSVTKVWMRGRKFPTLYFFNTGKPKMI